jgi:hypothetical protein
MGAKEPAASRRPAEIARMSGFRFRLYSLTWDELGEFATVVPNWSQEDEFLMGDGRRFRITGIVQFDDDCRRLQRALESRASRLSVIAELGVKPLIGSIDCGRNHVTVDAIRVAPEARP